MNISTVSGFNTPLSATSRSQLAQSAGSADTDGDGDGGRVHRARAGRGQAMDALMQALQALGLPVAQGTSVQATAGAASAGQAAGSPDGDGDSDGSAQSASSLKQDLHQFMHALFQAIRSESPSASSTADGSSTDPKNGFSAKLSALISQVSNGSAPADLQGAFSKLAADLQSAKPAVAANAAAGATTSDTLQHASLQSLLTLLQQNMGYGSTAGASTAGNVISTQA